MQPGIEHVGHMTSLFGLIVVMAAISKIVTDNDEDRVPDHPTYCDGEGDY
jgi:hypothetical protein